MECEPPYHLLLLQIASKYHVVASAMISNLDQDLGLGQLCMMARVALIDSHDELTASLPILVSPLDASI